MDRSGPPSPRTGLRFALRRRTRGYLWQLLPVGAAGARFRLAPHWGDGALPLFFAEGWSLVRRQQPLSREQGRTHHLDLWRSRPQEAESLQPLDPAPRALLRPRRRLPPPRNRLRRSAQYVAGGRLAHRKEHDPAGLGEATARARHRREARLRPGARGCFRPSVRGNRDRPGLLAVA